MNNKLIYNDKKHTYKYNGVYLTPSTKWIKQFFAPFDEKAVARKLNKMKPTKWYKMGIRKILALWKAQREEGTLVHKQIERYILDDKDLTNESWHLKTIQAVKLLNEIQKKLGEPILYPEMQVYNINWLLAGTIDLVIEHNQELLGKETNKRVVSIVDWKTNNKLNMTSDSFALPPFHSLPDCNFTQYSLQLNLYALMLERLENVEVQSMYIAHLEDEGARLLQVPDLRKELLSVLEGEKNGDKYNK